jgi:hypothetical protein
MKLTLNPFKQKRSKRWWTISIIAHGIVVLMLAQIVFRYPLGQLMGLPREKVKPERVQYITLPKPSGTEGGVTTPNPAPAAPAPLQTPAVTPSTITNPPAIDSVRSRAAGATGTGLDDIGSGLVTGVSPRAPDSRIALNAGQPSRVVRTNAETVDSVISLAIGIVNDSIAIAAGQRKPGDWTIKGKGGTWGWDPNGNIRLGKFTIPGALLALLPLNVQSPMSPIEQRSVAWIRQDILYNAQRSITEDEFRASVKRIRERKEKERRQKMLASSGRDSTAQ